jgi:hypothetical protein
MMPANPTTGIDVDVDRFAIWRASTSQYTNFNAVWPRTDGGQIVGANPDFEYYKRVNTDAPDADHRYTVATTWGRVATTPTPSVGLPMGTYEPSYTLTLRPVAELKLQVDAEFQRQVRLTFPDSENPATIIEAAGVIARKQAGTPITTEQQTLLDSFIGMEDVISHMRARQLALYDAIDNEEDYDITTGWTLE